MTKINKGIHTNNIMKSKELEMYDTAMKNAKDMAQ
jgi:hypothetical protein